MRWQQARNAARHAKRELGAQVLKEELRAQDPWQRISFLPHLVNFRTALSHFVSDPLGYLTCADIFSRADWCSLTGRTRRHN
jgi:hypothetical protein